METDAQRTFTHHTDHATFVQYIALLKLMHNVAIAPTPSSTQQINDIVTLYTASTLRPTPAQPWFENHNPRRKRLRRASRSTRPSVHVCPTSVKPHETATARTRWSVELQTSLSSLSLSLSLHLILCVSCSLPLFRWRGR